VEASSACKIKTKRSRILLDIKEARRKIGKNENGLYRFIKDYEFPDYCQIIKGIRFWDESDIDTWISGFFIADYMQTFMEPPYYEDIIFDAKMKYTEILTNDKY